MADFYALISTTDCDIDDAKSLVTSSKNLARRTPWGWLFPLFRLLQKREGRSPDGPVVSAAGRIYQPELTGLRGVAIAIVVFGHLLQRIERFRPDNVPSTSFENGVFAVLATPFSGCCLFFCLSGYSFMTYLIGRKRSNEAPKSFEYVARQMLRICPPYFVVLIGTYIFLKLTNYVPTKAHLFYVRPNSLGESLLASLTFTHYVLFGTFPRLFGAGWFLEAQVQFYLVAPFVAGLHLQIGLRHLRLRIGGLLLAMFTGASLLCSFYGPQDLQYSIIVFMPFFWVGALLADFWNEHDGGAHQMLRGTLSYVGWFALGTFILLGMPPRYPVPHLIAQLLCVALIVNAAMNNRTSLHRALTNRTLAIAGFACYSIFLVHLQTFQIVTPIVYSHFRPSSVWSATIACILVELPIAALLSYLFYRLIERPWAAAARALSATRSAVRTPAP